MDMILGKCIFQNRNEMVLLSVQSICINEK